MTMSEVGRREQLVDPVNGGDVSADGTLLSVAEIQQRFREERTRRGLATAGAAPARAAVLTDAPSSVPAATADTSATAAPRETVREPEAVTASSGADDTSEPRSTRVTSTSTPKPGTAGGLDLPRPGCECWPGTAAQARP